MKEFQAIFVFCKQERIIKAGPKLVAFKVNVTITTLQNRYEKLRLRIL